MNYMKRWKDEQKDYKIINEYLKEKLISIIESENIKATVTARVKKDLSLKRKVMRKGNNGAAYDSIIDKSGLRITCCYINDLNKVWKLVDDIFEVIKTDDKREDMKSNTMGYQAIHLDIKIKNKEDKLEDKHLNLISEVQIRTALQSAWGENSHDLTYKNIRDIPDIIKRKVNLLNAIIEVADNEFNNIYEYISNLDTISVYGIYFILIDAFYTKFRIEFNSEFTLYYLETFFEYYKDKFTVSQFKDLINQFIIDKYETILHVFKNRTPLKDDELFFKQPELIMIFYSLLTDKVNFISEWNKYFDNEILNTIASWFGISLL